MLKHKITQITVKPTFLWLEFISSTFTETRNAEFKRIRQVEVETRNRFTWWCWLVEENGEIRSKLLFAFNITSLLVVQERKSIILINCQACLHPNRLQLVTNIQLIFTDVHKHFLQHRSFSKMHIIISAVTYGYYFFLILFFISLFIHRTHKA